jgi:hypothetical protein
MRPSARPTDNRGALGGELMTEHWKAVGTCHDSCPSVNANCKHIACGVRREIVHHVVASSRKTFGLIVRKTSLDGAPVRPLTIRVNRPPDPRF